MSKITKIGVVGYSDDKCFDHDIAKALLAIALNIVDKEFESEDYELVSGLSNCGVPKLAYEIAEHMGWTTYGISAMEALKYERYPVDKEILIGEKFGEESLSFINYIDVLVRIGGDNQSVTETVMAREKGIPVYEYDLPRNK